MLLDCIEELCNKRCNYIMIDKYNYSRYENVLDELHVCDNRLVSEDLETLTYQNI